MLDATRPDKHERVSFSSENYTDVVAVVSVNNENYPKPIKRRYRQITFITYTVHCFKDKNLNNRAKEIRNDRDGN